MKRLAVTFLALVALAIGPPVAATTVEDLTLARAVELSSAVIVGEVTSRTVVELQPGAIVTDYLVHVEDSLAGAPLVGIISVRHLGGVIDGRVTLVPGMPQFVTGERVILFLIPGLDGATYRTLGLFQGAYTLTDTDDGVVAVRKPADGALIVGQEPRGRMPTRAPLDELAAAIRRHGVRP